MIQVVAHEKSKRTWFVQCNRTWGRQTGRSHIANEPCNLAIVMIPKFHQRFPVAFSIIGSSNPFILVVFWEHELRAILSTDKSLMIVTCRIHEVADNFRDRPTIWSGFCICGWRTDIEKPPSPRFDQRFKLGSGINMRRHSSINSNILRYNGNHHRVAAKKVSKVERRRLATSVRGIVIRCFWTHPNEAQRFYDDLKRQAE